MARYKLQRVVTGLVTQVSTIGESDDSEALKIFAEDECEYSGTHFMRGDWYPNATGGTNRVWRSNGGHHGGAYRISEIRGDDDGR